MKKIAIAALVLLAMSLAANAGQAATILKVKVQMANIRAQADTSGAVIKQVSLGTLLESRAKVGDWFEITITTDAGGQVVGYISATVVDVVSGGQIQAPVPIREEAPVRQPERIVPREEAPPAVSGSSPSTGGFKIIVVPGLANMSFTDMSGANISQYQKARFGVGGGIGFEMGRRIGIEVDLLYLQKGVRFTGNSAGPSAADTFDTTLKLDEVSSLLLMKGHVFNKGGLLDIYLLGGGEIAYLMSAKLDLTASGPDILAYYGTNSVEFKDQDNKDSFNKFDFGFVFGGGVTLRLGGLKIFGELRYHLGIADMEKAAADGTTSGSKAKTNLLAIATGIKF